MLHSARRDKRHQAPFYLLANVDIWVNRMEGPKTLGVMTDLRFYCRDRRPYWAALASQLGEGSIGIKNLLESVRAKLLGGLPSFAARELEQLLKRAVEALSVLGVRACLNMVPQCQLSQDLVAQYIRTLYSISAGRDAVVTGYFSEPVLAMPAGQLTNAVRKECEVLLEDVVRSLQNGQVNAGFGGELVARLLLLIAWDRCVQEGQSPSYALMSTRFLDAVQLVLFLASLLRLDDQVKADLRLSVTFEHATVLCTHIVNDYVQDSVDLLELFKRGAAAYRKITRLAPI